MRKPIPLASVIAAALTATPVLAADMAVKAPPAAPISSWTGFYVGGNVGYGFGHASGDLNDPSIGFYSGLGSLPTSFAESLNLKNPIGGGQFGYNYRIDPHWVVGFEADLQLANQHAGSSQGASTGGTFVGPGITSITSSNEGTTFESTISWFGTARARGGVLITPTILLYGTGGLAFGRVKAAGSGAANISITECIAGYGCIPTGTAGEMFVFSQSATRIGWTLGGGIEGALTGNWTWRAEYLYLYLGSESGSVADSFGGVATWSAKFTDNILRAGFDYRFGN